MSGTREGWRKAAAKNIARNPNFYAEIGRKGGKTTFADNGIPKGFAANPDLARIAGRKGGRISKRTKQV